MGKKTWNRPIILEHPGPPLNQAARGAVVGLFRASKNQNHLHVVRKREGKEGDLGTAYMFMFVPTDR